MLLLGNTVRRSVLEIESPYYFLMNALNPGSPCAFRHPLSVNVVGPALASQNEGQVGRGEKELTHFGKQTDRCLRAGAPVPGQLPANVVTHLKIIFSPGLAHSYDQPYWLYF